MKFVFILFIFFILKKKYLNTVKIVLQYLFSNYYTNKYNFYLKFSFLLKERKEK